MIEDTGCISFPDRWHGDAEHSTGTTGHARGNFAERRVGLSGPSAGVGAERALALDTEKPSIEALYPHLSPRTGEMFRLLSEACALADSVEVAVGESNALVADDERGHLHAVLMELFLHRDIGDGFGAVVNALAIALERIDAPCLNVVQARGIGRTLNRLRQEPFIDLGGAVSLIENLEDSGLIVDPKGLDGLADLNEQSLR